VASAFPPQARARGMIDRKKVKDKRRRHGGKKKRPSSAVPAAPANDMTRTSSAKASLGTSKDRVFRKKLSSGGSSAGSSLHIPNSSTPSEPLRAGDVPPPPAHRPPPAPPGTARAEQLERELSQDKLALEALAKTNSELERKVEDMKAALEQVQARCQKLEAERTVPELPHASSAGARHGNDPEAEQEKAAARRYLDERQVHAVLKDLVAELVLQQPSDALQHMYKALGKLVGCDSAAEDGGQASAFRMRMYFECAGPLGASRIHFKRIAKVGEREGERLEPPVLEWAREALAEFSAVLQGGWVRGHANFAPPENLRISLSAS